MTTGQRKNLDVDISVGQGNTLRVSVPVRWDAAISEWLMTIDGQEWIDKVKANGTNHFLNVNEDAGRFIVDARYSKRPPKTAEEAYALYRKNVGASRGDPTLTESDFKQRWDLLDATVKHSKDPNPPPGL